jgi:primosomal protein N' (replication factor Y)
MTSSVHPVRTPEQPGLVLSQPDTARIYLKERIAGTQGQLLIIVPEISLAEYLHEQFGDGQSVLVHSDMSAKKVCEAHRRVLTGDARIVFGTRIALFLPFPNLEQIIVEDPLHEAYKSDMTPRYNAPDVARMVAETYRASLTYLSPALSTANTHAISAKVLEFTDHKPYWPLCIHADMADEQQSGNRSI